MSVPEDKPLKENTALSCDACGEWVEPEGRELSCDCQEVEAGEYMELSPDWREVRL